MSNKDIETCICDCMRVCVFVRLCACMQFRCNRAMRLILLFGGYVFAHINTIPKGSHNYEGIDRKIGMNCNGINKRI